MIRPAGADRVPILYLAPWVDYGGADTGTIDWFRWLDRERFAPSLITTQPSRNRRIRHILPYAEEVWTLPDLMTGRDMPPFIFDFIHSRNVELIHVMNSRLGFDLLADLAALPRPPRVVVQLHVEEPDRSGYVRYVTARYGNLVDAFSVSSRDLADRVYGYGISRDRIRVIYSGVDAEEEFARRRARPVEGLAPNRVHILFPGRMVEQKDPLLMAEVVAAVRAREPAFQVHAVGDGHLAPVLRERLRALDLEQHVLIHPPTPELQRWYAGCDLLLMTSAFEGVPFVAYEALAMELPIVAPALPGNVELLDGLAGALIEPRDDVNAYADALAALIREPRRRQELGRRGRGAAIERLSVRRMADEHTRLYGELVRDDRRASNSPVAAGDGRNTYRAPLRLRSRRLHETALVSVIVPCFNQGRWLRECLDSIAAQTYPAVETIVVDDGSYESETRQVLNELEAAGVPTLIRLPTNRGPSRARNVGIDHCAGRYVLFVDADNTLLPEAVEKLIAQLKGAGEEIGFIYPNVQFFGNRDDYFEAPPWNLYELLMGNCCDVCSLFDRHIFDAGMRFDDKITLGHEDWEFILRLAARGVRGEPARGPTFRYRKLGFNRSDSVEYAATAFQEVMQIRAELAAHAPAIKSRCSPELSLIALQEIDARGEAGRRLARRLAAQSCVDCELIGRYDGIWPAPPRELDPLRNLPPLANDPPPAAIRIPPALSQDAGEALVEAWKVARGPLVAVTAGTGSDLLADPGFVEKVLRIFAVAEREGPPIGALVLGDTADIEAPPLQPVDGHDQAGLIHTVVIPARTEDRLPRPLAVDRGHPVQSILHACVGASRGEVQWRHLTIGSATRPPEASGEVVALPRRAVRLERGKEAAETWPHRPTQLPALPEPGVRRWGIAGAWTPPQSIVLCRHRDRASHRRIVTNSLVPPPGFEFERQLGYVRNSALVGTVKLRALADDYTTVNDGAAPAPPPSADEDLGWVETAALPGLDGLIRVRDPASGQIVLACGQNDPLISQFEPLGCLGFLEPVRAVPASPPRSRNTFGLVGLTQAVDRKARRHRCAAGSLAEGDVVGELGALLASPPTGGIPIWIVDGRAVTAMHRPPASRPSLTAAARWALAPLRWRGFSSKRGRLRAVAWRCAVAASRLVRRPRPPLEPDGEPEGWLKGEGSEGLPGLWCAYHPVTGDQRLSRTWEELVDMGYRQEALLGFLHPEAPLTGEPEMPLTEVSWASRFGLAARRG